MHANPHETGYIQNSLPSQEWNSERSAPPVASGRARRASPGWRCEACGPPSCRRVVSRSGRRRLWGRSRRGKRTLLPAPIRFIGCCCRSRPFQDTREAIQALEFYRRRWSIEEYFKVLKSGARIEDRRLDHADDLRKCLAFDAITAWRVFDLDRLAREQPELPAAKALPKEELETLDLLLRDLGFRSRRNPPPDSKNRTIRQAVTDIGRLAGFQPSRRQPLPGNVKLWQGYVYLKPTVRIYILMKQQE